MHIAQITARCRKLNINYQDVQHLAGQLADRWDAEHEREFSIRKAAWARCCPQQYHERRMCLWKCFGQPQGYLFNDAFLNGGDWTSIPGLDVVSEDLAREFPELDEDNRPPETLFKLLQSPVAVKPSRLQFLSEALEQIIIETDPDELYQDTAVVGVPF